MSMTLLEMVKVYKEIKELRMKLEKAAKELKEGKEAEFQAAILQHMLENDVKSVKYEGIGQVIRTSKSHYEIKDKEAFARAIFNSMLEAAQGQRPLAEAMLAQMRVSKDLLEAYMEHASVAAETCGVSLVEKPELSIRK